MTATEFELTDRLGTLTGTVAMSGIQALMRVPLDRQRADAVAGLSMAGLIAGYRGSPLTGVDEAYERDRALFDAHQVRFISGVNEDLAATMIWGSQLAHLEGDRRFDAVFGLWYGKGPGLDRSLDALRHANLSGVDPRGGVLAVFGDDPACKSSTVPSASEGLTADLGMPTLYPGSVQEVLDFGRWGYELSRYCGSWVGFKLHTDVGDQYATVNVDPGRLSELDRPDRGDWLPTQGTTLIAPASLDLETDTFGPRLRAAQQFVAANELDVTIGPGPARLGIVAAGKMYGDVRSVLAELGLASVEDLAAAGVRIYKPAMIWPLEPVGLARFAAGLDEIVVVEEKRPLLETQIRDQLFHLTSRPRVTGKRGPDGADLLPGNGALTADLMLAPLLALLDATLGDVELRRPRTRIKLLNSAAALPGRTPYFCSGCPHNRSTVVPEGSLAGAGIGCHTMASWMDRGTVGLTHMGGEGAQWAGMAPFVGHEHRFQNIGDGTFFHSGSMAIRQAVSAGTNVTYKVLYNGTVAMTGGQDAAGAMPVPDVTRLLEAEGVVRTVVVTDDVDKYGSDANWAPSSRVEHRDNYDAVQLELRDIPGVTAVVYDQRCAAELRRDRKRGRVETPSTRIMINEAVCDGCGDCGRISNCMSVHPVDTPFGRKTRIHQESCNFDYTCVQGNCPAFISVEVDPDHKTVAVGSVQVPDGPQPPEPAVPDAATVLIVGIGGTGVVTVSQVLSTAALIDGKNALSLDQTGLAQKGGRVISNLKISPEQREGTPRVGGGEADTALIFDVLGGSAPEILDRCSPDRTSAVVSSVLLPVGAMVRDVQTSIPQLAQFREPIDAATKAANNVWLDAEGIARRVFGSQPAANLLVVGLAYQRGLIPVSAAAIESAIGHNGVAVQLNVDAFRLGRRLAVEPDLLADLDEEVASVEPPPLSGRDAELAAKAGGDTDLDTVLRWRIPELVAYQDRKYAARYVDVVAKARGAELAVGAPDSRLSQTVAFQLFKLMAYKDEYEVARLHLGHDMATEVRSRFGPKATFSYMLEPPALKKLGRKRKTAVPEKAGRAMFTTLLRGKRARGTRLDPFGRTEERRIERELLAEYPELVDTVIAGLTAENLEAAIDILALADQIRGFDQVKLDNVARYRSEVAAALATFPGGVASG